MVGTLQCMTTKSRLLDNSAQEHRKREDKTNLKNIFVVFGNQNSGKTHTAWLIYNLLKKNGYDIPGLFNTHDDQERLTYNGVLDHIRASFENHDTIALSDFRAMLEIEGRRVAIFSAGDYVDDDWGVTSFVKNMKWSQYNDAAYIVCCARSYNRTNSVHNLLKKEYEPYIFKWYKKQQSNNLHEQLNDVVKVAKEICDDLKMQVNTRNYMSYL